ncbi:hypothetical protein Pmani_004113 [Petrolisthes manimaculis]|uniref:Uncharacterized protein n=1 Tax=Petrolisthes manimaculis TaxID=1843537 RepID=A0AAE1QFJ8_9EUCA|nr:hypothetical protein Pmani_004113 [Petrolisthes manimaculis]
MTVSGAHRLNQVFYPAVLAGVLAPVCLSRLSPPHLTPLVPSTPTIICLPHISPPHSYPQSSVSPSPTTPTHLSSKHLRLSPPHPPTPSFQFILFPLRSIYIVASV